MFIKIIQYRGNQPSLKIMQEVEGYVVMFALQHRLPGLEPEDVAQELRLHLWRRLPSYDPRKASPKSWARTVLWRKVIDLSAPISGHTRSRREPLDAHEREVFEDPDEYGPPFGQEEMEPS